MLTLERFVTKDGGIPEEPEPAYVVMQDGEPFFTLTRMQLDEILNDVLDIEELRRAPKIHVGKYGAS